MSLDYWDLLTPCWGAWVDDQFLKVFFMTYRSFMSPMELLKLLSQRYEGPAEFIDDPESWPV